MGFMGLTFVVRNLAIRPLFYYKRSLFTMKLTTPEFTGLFTPNLNNLVDLFNKNSYEIRIAGGAVRDILLGKTPKDVDFATTATPDQMKEMFNKENVRMINEKGETHGTITARIGEENFEITTLRIDVATDGRHAEVEFTKDWELDAERRDLTINSMFLGTDGTLYDYFNGHEDLKKRKVVFVGNPSHRITEDYLRILRYFRFYGRIAENPDNHDEDTLKAISENASGLARISGERIWQELFKILSGNFIAPLMEKMIQLGLAPHIGLPEEPNLNEMKKVASVAKHLGLHPIGLIAALLNNEDEMYCFHKRCKLSAFEQELGLLIIQLRHEEDSSPPIRRYQDLVIKADGKGLKLAKQICELLKYKADLSLLSEFQSWQIPKFPITGFDLKELGVPPGKPLGFLIGKLKDIWISNNCQSTKIDLLSRVPSLAEECKIKLSLSKDNKVIQ